MIKRFKAMTIFARFIISFTLVVMIFAAGAIYSNYTTAYVDRLHRHNLDFVIARLGYVMDAGGEFTAMRRLFRATVTNAQWREDASPEMWEETEAGMRDYLKRVEELGELYIISAMHDGRLDAESQEERVFYMMEAVANVNAVFYLIYDNFFRNGNGSFDDTSVSARMAQTDALFSEIRLRAEQDRENALEYINNSITLYSNLSVGAILLGISASFGIIYMLAKSFNSSVKEAEKQIRLIESGDFKAILENENGNEISKIPSKLVRVFTQLIDAIHNVAGEVTEGNSDKRIDAGGFRGNYKDVALAVNHLLDIMTLQKKSLKDAVTKEFEASERARILFESAPVLIEVWDENYNLIDCNRHCVDAYGLDVKEEYLASVYELVPDYQLDGSPSTEAWHNNLKKITKDKSVFFHQWITRKPGGELMHMDIVGTMMQLDGKDVYVTYSVDNLSKQEAQEAMKRARLIMDYAPLSISFWDESLTMIDCNDYFMQLCGQPDKEKLLATFLTNHLPALQSCGTPTMGFIQRYAAKALRTGSAEFELISLDINGGEIPCHATAIYLETDKGRAFAVYVKDLRLEKEAAKQIDEANAKFKVIFDNAPRATSFWDFIKQDERLYVKITECNNAFMNLFEIWDKQVLLDKFPHDFLPEYQENGMLTTDAENMYIEEVYKNGAAKFEWLFLDINGEPLPCEITLIGAKFHGKHVMISYAQDLREARKTEALLDMANEHARLIFNDAPLAISSWSLVDGILTILDCNEAFMQTFGVFDKKTLLDNFPGNFTPQFQPGGEESIPTVIRYTDKAIEDGSYTFEWMHTDVNGDPVPCEITSVATTWRGELIVIAYARDLRKEKKAAAMLSDANTRARIFFERVPMAVTFWSDDLRPLDCNDELARMFGVKNKLEYLDDFYRFSPEYQPDGRLTKVRAIELFKEAYEKGAVSFDWMHLTAQDAPLPVRITLVHIQLQESSAYVAYFYDMREIFASQEEVREANERVRLMLDSSPVACFLVDKNFFAIDCNIEAASLFEVADKKECISRFNWVYLCENCAEHNPADDLMRDCRETGEGCVLRTCFDDALSKGHSKIEWRVSLPNKDELIPCEINFVRLMHKGDFVVAAYVIDLRTVKKMIEDMKRLEEAEENSMAKTKFLARMSHEIRTPITAVMGISEIQLQNPGLSLELEEAFAKIYSSSETLLGIINDILDISKIEAGKMEIITENYEVASMIVDAAQLHLVYLGSKDINFSIKLDENMPANFIGDELRIKQVLSNILSNAIKYTDAGGVHMEMRCKFIGKQRQIGDLAFFIITVSDTGKGMTQSQLKALSDDYARFHEKEARFVQGTGLGMPIVYNLIELMGGTIEVTSEAGVGTTVTVILPQIIACDESVGTQTAEAISSLDPRMLTGKQKINFVPHSMPYGSVLVVDDVETNLYVARGLMELYDLQIETVNSGQAAIERVKNGKVYDIIFMDHMMPEMNGIEATRIIRHLGYTGTIVAFTANALIGQAEEFTKNGFDGFISKPIQTVHLNNILNKFVRDKQPTEVLENAAQGKKVKAVSVESYMENQGIHDKIRKDFLRTKKNAFKELTDAIDNEDLETAHRLAHNLKGLAGLIGENELMELAQKAENILRDGGVPTKWLGAIQLELTAVLEKIGEQFKDKLQPELERNTQGFDKEKAAIIFDELTPLLEQRRGSAMDFLNQLALIPQTEELINQIEDFEFALALETLEKLRNLLEV